MKLLRWILLLAMAAAICSCGSGRKVTRGHSAEEEILVELQQQQDQRGSKKKDKKSKKEAQTKLLNEAYSWKGTPYSYGGASKKGTDCSGFVMQVFLVALDIKLPRSSMEQAQASKKINKKELIPGDLVFFRGGQKGKVNHVGIYVGDNKMIHASSSKGVIVSSLSDNYWVKHYYCCGRVPQYEKMVK